MTAEIINDPAIKSTIWLKSPIPVEICSNSSLKYPSFQKSSLFSPCVSQGRGSWKERMRKLIHQARRVARKVAVKKQTVHIAALRPMNFGWIES